MAARRRRRRSRRQRPAPGRCPSRPAPRARSGTRGRVPAPRRRRRPPPDPSASSCRSKGISITCSRERLARAVPASRDRGQAQSRVVAPRCRPAGPGCGSKVSRAGRFSRAARRSCDRYPTARRHPQRPIVASRSTSQRGKPTSRIRRWVQGDVVPDPMELGGARIGVEHQVRRTRDRRHGAGRRCPG